MLESLTKLKKLAQGQAWYSGYNQHIGGKNLQRANQWLRHHQKLDTAQRYREATEALDF